MKKEWYGRDRQLTVRMFLVMFLLAALYLMFLAFLWKAGIGFVAMALIAGGLLLAALVQFSDSEQRCIYWVYNCKRGRFYPFVPLPDKKRNHAIELRLQALMENEMPLEPEIERWYPLWDIPLTPERVHHR